MSQIFRAEKASSTINIFTKFCWAQRLFFLLLTCYPVGNMERGRQERRLSIDLYQCLHRGVGYIERAAPSPATRNREWVLIHICVLGLWLKAKREFCLSNSTGIFKDLKLPNFDCYALSSQSWLGGSPILKQVGTSCNKHGPSFKWWDPWLLSLSGRRAKSRVSSEWQKRGEWEAFRQAPYLRLWPPWNSCVCPLLLYHKGEESRAKRVKLRVGRSGWGNQVRIIQKNVCYGRKIMASLKRLGQ